MDHEKQFAEDQKLRDLIQLVKEGIDRILERDRLKNVPAKILIVDDDPHDVFLLGRQLEKFNCAVQVSMDASKARQKIVDEKFDFVFLDQKMPKTSGLELLRATLPNSQAAQFFIVTGIPDSPLVDQTLRLGALFLPKPVTDKLLALFLRPKNP